MIVQVLLFIAVLAVLVLTHEFGHFIVARWVGIKVEEFGFGFPPRLFKWQGKKTLYSFNALPLGGFVKLKGEDQGDRHDPEAFISKKPWIRAAVLSAGVVMNLLLAVVLFSVGYMYGVPTALDSSSTLPAGSNVRDQKVQILDVVKGSPADIAGMKGGDVVLLFGGIKAHAEDIVREIPNAFTTKKPLLLSVLSAGIMKDIEIMPVELAELHKPGIGVSMTDNGVVSYPWYRALWEGLMQTYQMTIAVFVGMAQLIGTLFSGKGVGEAVSGPVGIAVLTSQVAQLGLAHLIQFIGMLSINLAVLNILPIPALDGGRLLFVIIEKIRRKPMAGRGEQISHIIGFAALILLVLVVSVRDVLHLIK